MKIVYFIVFLGISAAISLENSAAEHSTSIRYVDMSKAYFLSTRGPKKRKLICYMSENKPLIGIDPKATTSGISYREFKGKSADKKILKKALKECNIKLTSPACSDGCDNDEDGKIDYPADAECTSADDASETESDPSATPIVTLSACNDGIDNDADGKIDYPEDKGCHSAGDNDEFNQAEQLTRFSVFRKPFAGEHYTSSMFDHKYPQEFVHVDGSIVTHDNELTTIGVDGHQGYDFGMDEGTEVLAAYDGTVTYAGTEDTFFCPPLNKMVAGKIVFLRHQVEEEQFDSLYGHFSSISVSTGQVVKKGDVIGLSGNTGCSTGPHLHFDIRRRTNTNGGTPSSIDPSGWIATSDDPWKSHPSGTESFRLWASGEAPLEYREVNLPPNPGENNSAAVAITTLRWAGPLDDLDPNNEFIEITIDPRFYPSATYPIAGATLRNNKDEKFTFPAGSQLQSGQPVRIYSGSGVNSATEYYWGRTTGAWDNSGDCARIIRASGVTTYAFSYGTATCTVSGASTESIGNEVHFTEIKE
jgi:hypothetical protein